MAFDRGSGISVSTTESDVSKVAQIDDEVVIVSNNISSVVTNANNITSIQNAASNAASAAISAASASSSAASALSSSNTAVASALTAVNAPGTSGTSTTSASVGLGNITLTTQTSKAWVAGQFVVIAETTNPTTVYMYGNIVSYNSGTGVIVVNSTNFIGSGTYSSWVISLTAPAFGIEQADIGTAADQVPLNQYLGALAYKDFIGFIETKQQAPTVASAATIAPTSTVTFVSGTTTINTITVPAQINEGGILVLIPTGLWSTGTSGNIAIATTAVVSKALIMIYDAGTAKWYPSY